MRRHLRRPGVRFLVYGFVGWTLDSLFVWANTGRRRPSGLLNLPVYGLAQPLFEPVHDRIGRRPLVLRATTYGTGVLGVEYACGRLLRRLVGRVPWDYGGARFDIDGLVRLDYLPLWAASRPTPTVSAWNASTICSCAGAVRDRRLRPRFARARFQLHGQARWPGS